MTIVPKEIYCLQKHDLAGGVGWNNGTESDANMKLIGSNGWPLGGYLRSLRKMEKCGSFFSFHCSIPHYSESKQLIPNMNSQTRFLSWNYSIYLCAFEANYAIEHCFLVQSPLGCRLWLAICLSSQNPHARLARRCLLSFDLRSVFVLLILSHTRSIVSKQSIRLMDTLSHFHTCAFIKQLHLWCTFLCVRAVHCGGERAFDHSQPVHSCFCCETCLWLAFKPTLLCSCTLPTG